MCGISGWVVFFPLLALPLVALVRIGLSALRGRPLRRTRGAAVQLSLVGMVGTILFAVLMVFFGTPSWYGWGRGSFRTDIFIAAGLPVSLLSWVLALIASVLLPAKSGR